MFDLFLLFNKKKLTRAMNNKFIAPRAIPK